MYRRLIILSVIILSALCGLSVLGYHAVEKWAEGLQGARLGEFAEVAEQIRQDVNRKLDEFILTEQDRPYTDYQYYYVPENVAPGRRAQQVAFLRSPLAGRLDNSFAWGNFQIESNGTIITPNDDIVQREGATGENKILLLQVQFNRKNIETNLLPVLNGVTPASFKMAFSKEVSSSTKTALETLKQAKLAKGNVQKSKDAKVEGLKGRQGKDLPIESLRAQQQKTQIIQQQRQTFIDNVAANTGLQQRVEDSRRRQRNVQTDLEQSEEASQSALSQPQIAQIEQALDTNVELQLSRQEEQSDTVQVRVGGFEPIVTGGGNAEESIFGGQVFLVRNVQIEDTHFLQGFQLNEKKLIQEVKESTRRLMRDGMSFELPQTKNGWAENKNAAYTAVLVFDFGELVLNLMEIDPAWIAEQISQLRHWYFGIISIVLLAVTLALASLWLSARTQLKLAQKKDDFISAVSHELRTPLTSIRMYSEMLEKNWVKSEDKLAEYYGSMRAESERLSRLIENVLDFSRIQKGRKKYTFSLGDINECIADVVEMMKPYAEQNGFSIKTELGQLGQTAFDPDAVTQIVVNLVDNAIKYARNAQDKIITVRTRSDDRFILIEVEDHGPGVPHRLRYKVFEEFFRSGSEATRETTGTGLGLALVKKFAQAHDGFVEIITARPIGAIFRVALAAR
ncbi:MAG TPA: HAMP domain-containing histidine kinase [Planctomycetes bacterium]|nr:HAMP domain-containing histidine kinase [Planctomycetota bacterium]